MLTWNTAPPRSSRLTGISKGAPGLPASLRVWRFSAPCQEAATPYSWLFSRLISSILVAASNSSPFNRSMELFERSTYRRLGYGKASACSSSMALLEASIRSRLWLVTQGLVGSRVSALSLTSISSREVVSLNRSGGMRSRSLSDRFTTRTAVRPFRSSWCSVSISWPERSSVPVMDARSEVETLAQLLTSGRTARMASWACWVRLHMPGWFASAAW